MRLLLTRPREDAEALAETLRARGHEPLIAPVMDVRFFDGAPLPLTGIQGVIATSANGVRALSRRVQRRDITLYAVGPQTTEAARAEGFSHVVNADGDAQALVEIIAREAKPEAGPLLHAAGAETTGRLKQSLNGMGFELEAPVLYEAIAMQALSDAAAEALTAGTLDGVLLFSPRSAKIFADLVRRADLAESCARLDAFCISAATMAALGKLTFARLAVAGEPNQTAMLALLVDHG
jgi:uroporphyrinogen-III synthase